MADGDASEQHSSISVMPYVNGRILKCFIGQPVRLIGKIVSVKKT